MNQENRDIYNLNQARKVDFKYNMFVIERERRFNLLSSMFYNYKPMYL